MKRLRPIQVILAGAVVIAIALVCVDYPWEPKYAGKSLSYWLSEFERSGRGDFPDADTIWRQEEATTALGAMGTNAVPYLLKEAFNTKPDTRLRKAFYELLNRFPKSWKLPTLEDSEQKRWISFIVLSRLKPSTKLVLPQIKEAFNGTNHLLRLRAVELCGRLGDGAEEATPFLINAINGTDVSLRDRAIVALGELGIKGSAALPGLIEITHQQSRSNSVDSFMLITFGQYGSKATPALPDIKKAFLASTNLNLKASMATALCQIDERQEDAMEFLITRLRTETNTADQHAIIHHLAIIGPGAHSAIPYLLEKMDAKNLDMSYYAASALAKIGGSNELFMPNMEGFLRSDDAAVRISAAEEILRIDPANRKAKSFLLEVIRKAKDRDDIFSAMDTFINARAEAKDALFEAHQILVDRFNHSVPPDQEMAKAIKHFEFMMKAQAGRR